MKGLNKKLSEIIEKKTAQLESSSLKYILSLCLLSASINNIGELSAVQNTLIVTGLFWTGLSVNSGKRIAVYLSSLISAFYLMNHNAFLTGLIFAFLFVLSRKVSERENFHLLLTGIIAHIGDLVTTSIGLQRNLSEQNPFLIYIGNFTDISSGLIISKSILFLLVLYLYRRDVEGLDSMLKIFLASGFILALSNLDVIMSGT
jgi:hypothetical protein